MSIKNSKSVTILNFSWNKDGEDASEELKVQYLQEGDKSSISVSDKDGNSLELPFDFFVDVVQYVNNILKDNYTAEPVKEIKFNKVDNSKPIESLLGFTKINKNPKNLSASLPVNLPGPSKIHVSSDKENFQQPTVFNDNLTPVENWNTINLINEKASLDIIERQKKATKDKMETGEEIDAEAEEEMIKRPVIRGSNSVKVDPSKKIKRI